MPITTTTSVNGGVTYHDTTISLVSNGSLVARRVRRQLASDFVYAHDYGAPFEYPYTCSVFAPGVGAGVVPDPTGKNSADGEFLQMERSTIIGYSPILKNNPMQMGYLVKDYGSVLVAQYGATPTQDGFGRIYMADIYRLYAPKKFPDCALDVDLPAPWGNLRIIFDNQYPILTPRTPPSGYVRHAYRRGTSELFTNTLRGEYLSSGINSAYQVNDLGDSIVPNWWPYNSDPVGALAFDSTNIPSLYAVLSGQSIPAYQYSGPTYPSPPIGTFSPIRTGITVQGQWYRADYGVGFGYSFGFNPIKGAPIGGRFSIPYTDMSDPSTDLNAYLVINVAALTPPTLTQPTHLFLDIFMTADCYPYLYPDDPPGISGNVEHQVLDGGIYGGDFLATGFVAPPYYPWDMKFCAYIDDEASIRTVRHAGYIPPSAPSQVSLTASAPTLLRAGSVIYFRGGCAEFDDATATEADYLIQSTTPNGAGFIYPTNSADGWLESYSGYIWDSPSDVLRENSSSCLFRIFCPELGQEWSVGFFVKRQPEWTFNGTTWAKNGAWRVYASTSNFSNGTTGDCGTGIAGHHYPGPAILLPPEAAGKALKAEITVAQNILVPGGYRKVIRRWNPVVP